MDIATRALFGAGSRSEGRSWQPKRAHLRRSLTIPFGATLLLRILPPTHIQFLPLFEVSFRRRGGLCQTWNVI